LLARPRRLGLPVGYKVILPFLGLSMLAGLLATALVSLQLASVNRAKLDAEAIREEDSVSASFATFEQRQLTDQRSLAATTGVAAAVQARDAAVLTQLMLPAVVNQLPDPLRASVLDTSGNELVSLRADRVNLARCLCTSGRSLLGWSHVADVLAGRTDSYGPKYAAVGQDNDGPVLFTVGPIMDGGRVSGAVLVAEPLKPLLAEVRAHNDFEMALFDSGGNLLAGAPGFGGSRLTPADARAVQGGSSSVHRPATVGSQSGEVFYVRWLVRHADVGYAAVMVPPAALGTSPVNGPLLLVAVFGATALLTLATGLFVSRRITRPLVNLVQATEEVKRGNLAHRAVVISSDEVGALTDAFNEMTSELMHQQAQRELSTEATVQTLAAAIDARDPYTHGHSLRVTAYSVELALAVGLESDQVESVRRGCLVHDIGKIAIPDRILSKPAPLDADERAAMQRHAEFGHQMLRHLAWPDEVLDIVLHHHERWDGKGYPARLSGTGIPALARLVAIADTLDAMTSDRPYRKGFSLKRAADEIRRGAGTQFDPTFVETFLAVVPRLGKIMGEMAGDANVLQFVDKLDSEVAS
jgi:putative nucleotidyltransferase with HDIG domain